MVEMARIRLHGFSERELNQARASMMSDVESAYIERHQDYSQVGSPTLGNCAHICWFGQPGRSYFSAANSSFKPIAQTKPVWVQLKRVVFHNCSN